MAAADIVIASARAPAGLYKAGPLAVAVAHLMAAAVGLDACDIAATVRRLMGCALVGCVKDPCPGMSAAHVALNDAVNHALSLVQVLVTPYGAYNSAQQRYAGRAPPAKAQ